MIDLREFYLNSVNESDYYHRFYRLIDSANSTYNIFEGEQIADDCRFEVFDEDEAIDKFRLLCQPESEPTTKIEKCWFVLVAYFLNARGYTIAQFPNVLSRPPEEPLDFTYGDIRNRAFSLGLNDGNIIRYATRRQIVGDLDFVRRGSAIVIEEPLDQKIRLISARNASFEDMETDEKLGEIANLIENLLKVDGKFIQPDYSSVMFDYVDDGVVKKLRRQLQCFRHSSEEMLSERAAFSAEQKVFLVDFGVTVCKSLYVLVK